MIKQLYFKWLSLTCHLFEHSLQAKQFYWKYRTLSSATTLVHSEPGSDGNEGALRIPQSSNNTGILSSNFLMSYPVHSLEGSYPICRDAIDEFYNPSRLDKRNTELLRNCCAFLILIYIIKLFITNIEQFSLLLQQLSYSPFIYI